MPGIRKDVLLWTMAVALVAAVLSVTHAAPLVKNADFTQRAAGSQVTPAVWQMPAGKVWEDTNEDGLSGQDSMRYVARSEQVAAPVMQKVACQPNTEYVLSAAFKSDGFLQPMVRVREDGAAGGGLAQVASVKEAGPWRRYSAKFKSGGSTALIVELFADVRHSRNEAAPAGVCGIDDVQVRSAAEVQNEEQAAGTSQYENLAKGKPYTLSDSPNYALCTDRDDQTQLTDGLYSVGYFWTQTTTVGWQGRRPVIITIDLGKVEPIRGVSYNTAAGVAGVAWPLSVIVLVSDDGKTYYALGDLVAQSNEREAPPAEGYTVHRYWTDGLKAHGRYVQLMADSGGAYCFVDEIEVYRGDPSWASLAMSGEVTTGAAEYFRNNAVSSAIRGRLNADLRDARAAVTSAGIPDQQRIALLRELSTVEAEIKKMPPVDPVTFRAVLPLNDLHARLFAVYGKLRAMKGSPPLQAWVSHPLDYLTPTQGPDATSRKQISVLMMRGEWRSAVLNLTSSMDRPASILLRLEGLPGGPNPDYIYVYQVQWTDTKEQKPIAVALSGTELSKEGYTLDLPAGMVRQVWFTFHPVNLAPGTYSGKVVARQAGGSTLTVPLSLRVFPMTFPAQPTLHAGGWDYTDASEMYGVKPTNRERLVAHLQERFVDSPWGTSAVLPWGDLSDYDLQGNLKKDLTTTNFDGWVDRWPDARRYCVFVSVNTAIHGENMGTPRFNRIVGSWISFWVKHAATKGLKPEQLVLLLYDEPSRHQDDEIIAAWVKAVRAAQPQVVLWEDPTYLKPEEALPEMMTSVDVLCPNRVQMLMEGKHFEEFYRKQKAEGRRLDFYSCSGPMHLLDPYSYVRLQAWSCWDLGAESTFFWAFGDTGGGNPWQPYTTPGNNYAPMFLAPDSVTPGKHMEAIRESVEDFEYFVMLRQALAKARPGNPAVSKANELLATGARRVLEAENASKISWLEAKDRWQADNVRREILEALVGLMK